MNWHQYADLYGVDPFERYRRDAIQTEARRALAEPPQCACCGRDVKPAEAVGRPVCGTCREELAS